MLDDSMLLHDAAGYDPAKAREYYLRTRKLKGRKRKMVTFEDGSVGPAYKPEPKARTASPRKFSQDQLQARVAAVKTKVNRLQATLAELQAEKRKRSEGSKESSTSESTSTSKESSSSTSDRKPKTAAQKKADAKQHRDKYEPKKKTPSDMSVEELDAQITKVRATIRSVRAEISGITTNARPNSKAQSAKSKPRTAV